MSEREALTTSPEELAAAGFAPQSVPKPAKETAIPLPTPGVLEAARQIKGTAAPAQDPGLGGHEPQDVAAFMVHILGSTRYRKQYSFMGGAVVVDTRTLTGAEEDRITREVAAVPDLQIADRIRIHSELIALARVERLARSGQPTIILDLFESKDGIRAARQAFLEQVPALVVDLVLEASQRFASHYGQLAGKLDDPSFWKAASSDS